MANWFKALGKTRNLFKDTLGSIFTKKRNLDEATLEELEEELLLADVTPRLVAEIIDGLEKASRRADGSRRDVLKKILIDQLAETEPFRFTQLPPNACVLIVGVNGSGKTTTTAKLAHLAREQGLDPLMGAADTFRAAGTDQLRLWSEMVGCEVVAGKQGSDAAAVAYDSLDACIARKRDMVIIDTAGRMHNKAHLMDELKKIVRSLNKRVPEAPHETWIVLDASIGQNALMQARLFNEAVPLTGIIITKLDGSSKAGCLFSIKKELNIPIIFTGLGELKEDMVPFEAQAFVDGLLGIADDEQVDEG
ncbi:MAG: fused signal recognition particle receptor [Kiritimatiellia bacterium]|jgi:fused signal recognition particle receptor